MNRILLALPLAMLLLGGCGKPAGAPVAGVPASGAGNQAVSMPESVPMAADPASAATNDSSAALAIDDHADVNASIDRLLGDHARYEAVIEAYQKAVTGGDKAAVAALVAYPLKVDIRGSKVMIRDPAAFVRDYDRIVTPGIAHAVERQEYSQLMVNSQGVMFGIGETWINGVCKQGSTDCSEFEVKVVTIQPGRLML
ncbi:MAG: hypothetical protein ACREO7_04435 [Pseudoxanthomonas sp.]